MTLSSQTTLPSHVFPLNFKVNQHLIRSNMFFTPPCLFCLLRFGVLCPSKGRPTIGHGQGRRGAPFVAPFVSNGEVLVEAKGFCSVDPIILEGSNTKNGVG